jgi:hypothetical protein
VRPGPGWQVHFTRVVDTQRAAADSKDGIKSVECRARRFHGQEEGRQNFLSFDRRAP